MAIPTVALSDTEFAIGGVSTTSTDFDSVAAASVTWGSTPTINWAKRFVNGFNTYDQNMKMILNSDNTKVILVSASSASDILIHIFSISDGSFIKGKIGGFIGKPYFYGIGLKDNTLFVAAEAATTLLSTLFVYDISAHTGTAYQNQASTFLFRGIGPVFSDGTLAVCGGDTSSNKYTRFIVSSTHPSWFEKVSTTNSTYSFSQITDSSYDPVSFSLTPEATVSFPVSTATLTPSSVTTSVSSSKSLTLNEWSTHSESVSGGTTGGSFTPNYYCLVENGITAPVAAFSLVAGSGSVPSWTTLASSSGSTINYDSPNVASTEAFSLRTTFGGDSSKAYDTAISLTVTATSSGGSSGGSSDSSSESSGDSKSLLKGG